MRKDRLLERVFSQAEVRSGGDARGTFFDIFKGQLGSCFRLSSGSDGKDGLEPLDSQGKPLLGDDGRPMTTTEFLDQMRIHPVYGFLFQQRGPAGMQAAGGLTVSGIGSNGEPINPQAMTASELYRASFSINGRTRSRRQGPEAPFTWGSGRWPRGWQWREGLVVQPVAFRASTPPSAPTRGVRWPPLASFPLLTPENHDRSA